MSSESGRSLATYLIQNLVGDNNVENAIAKLCSSNEIALLRLVMALSVGVDPLIGRTEYVTSCRVATAGDVLELRFTTNDGSELCLGLYTSGNLRTATSCRSGTGEAAERGVGQVYVKVE
ncbi:MAG: hypothetical protein QXD83_06475 [Sulfolobales archaeon]